MNLYKNTNIQRVCRYALAVTAFTMGVSPMVAQEEVEDIPVQVAAPKKKVKLNSHKYPTYEIKGKVVDAATGEALAGVRVQSFNNRYYSALTDENGEYSVQVPKFITALTVSLDGYNTNVVSINGRTENIDVALNSDLFVKDTETQNVASRYVEVTDFENTNDLTVDQNLQSRLAGDVNVIQRSAVPGLGSAMFINGFNSLNSNAMPLIIVDGVVFDQMYDSEMLHTGYFNNLLQAINLNDVESVKVLKNGTAIYGAKAANGVIVITTKRCKSMSTTIDVNISGGVELMPSTMDMMNASEYRSYASQLLATTGTKLTEFKFLHTDPNYYYYNMYHNDTDWKKEAYHEAFVQNYGIAVQGGDDVAKYNLSVGYGNSQATLKENDFTRFNIRFNTDIVLGGDFTTKFDASYTNVTRDLRSNGLVSDFYLNSCESTSFLALAKAPFLSPYSFSTDGKVSSFVSDADNYLDEVLGTKASLANPTAILENGDAMNKNHTDCTMIAISLTPEWRPRNNLTVSEKFSYNMQSFDEAYFTPIVGMPSYKVPETESTTDNKRNSLYTTHNAIFSDTRVDWEALTTGAHRLSVFGGARFMNDTFVSSYLLGDNTGSDKTPNLRKEQKSKKRYGQDVDWRSLAYYVNVDYNFMERYYLQGQFSMETSSRFGKEAKSGVKMLGTVWGMFPSIQGAWVLTNEKWFRPNKGVNFLKVNVGFESVGNDAMDNSATLTYLSSAALLANQVTSLGLGNIGNSALAWETTKRFNAGFEGNFFSNRLNVRFNYFKSKTDNLITLGTLAYVAGLTDYYTNDGSLKNEGYDVAFRAKVVNNKNFKFELGASAGHYKNKITALPQGQNAVETSMYGATILTEVGRSAGVFYGYKTDGVYATTAEAKAEGHYIQDEAGNKTYYGAGDMRFLDINGDKLIDDNDRQIIGDPNPDIYGNINLDFHIYDRLTVSAGFKYSIGNDVYNYQRSLLESGSMFINQTTTVNRKWTNEGQVTDIPKATYGDPLGNSRFSDRWIEDGSYLKLKNVTVSYRFPVQNEYIKGLTVWGSANNLFTVSKYLGADPEVSCGNSVLVQGIDAGFLTSGRSFHLGVKINL